MVVCYVVGCNTGYKGKSGHVFKIPKGASDNIRRAWISNIPKRADKPWNFQTCRICDRHFEERFIVKKDQVTFNGEVIAEADRKHYKLTDDAVPTLFSNKKIPSYLQNARVPRKAPRERNTTPEANQLRLGNKNIKMPTSVEPDSNLFVANDLDNFDTFLEVLNSGRVPMGWIVNITGRQATCSKLLPVKTSGVLPSYSVERSLIFSEKEDPKAFVYKRPVQLQRKYLNSDWSQAVEELNAISVCPGLSNFQSILECDGGVKIDLVWFSKACHMINHSGVCPACLQLKPNLLKLGQKSCRPSSSLATDKNAQKSSKLQKLTQKVRRLSSKVISLKELSKDLKTQLKSLKPGELALTIEKENRLEPEMKMAMIAAANRVKSKSGKGTRYANDWLLQCLLIRITSPKAYRFLRNNNILALPHPDHLSKLLRGIPCQFGFNDFVMKTLEGQYSHKERKERQFMLCFDEIKVRESVEFDKLEGSFTGFIDYAEFTEGYLSRSKSSLKLADHALVLMCRNLHSKIMQPIASFASKGAAPGHVLAKILISAILKLEECGCEVAGVVCDGASTNKNLWKLLGISGTGSEIVNHITNPFDGNRKVFFFGDVPHIIKCVRNHFQKYQVVKYKGKMINWGFYQALFDLDQNRDVKLAHRLTEAHLKTGPFQKMIVSYATQIFSKSVANGIYLGRTVQMLNIFKGSEATEAFTRKLDEVFDLLNAKQPCHGIKSGSTETDVLKEFLACLCNEDNTFASDLTIQSFRVTLKSALDLIEYLCGEIGFDYVLTAKFNQDCLERFFGILRSVGGDDNHPTITTFTHLFRILSMYNPVKHQLKGNIRAIEDDAVLVSVGNLRKIAMERKVEAKRKQASRDKALKERISKNEHLLDFDGDGPNIPTTEDCIVYYLTGYISHKAQSFTSCLACQQSIKSKTPTSKAKIWTDIKSSGGLTYPSNKLFALINLIIEPVIKSELEKDLSCSGDILKRCIENVPNFNANGIGCSQEHEDDLVVKIVLHYITTRCYFHKRETNRMRRKAKSSDDSKSFAKKSKLSSH